MTTCTVNWCDSQCFKYCLNCWLGCCEVFDGILLVRVCLLAECVYLSLSLFRLSLGVRMWDVHPFPLPPSPFPQSSPGPCAMAIREIPSPPQAMTGEMEHKVLQRAKGLSSTFLQPLSVFLSCSLYNNCCLSFFLSLALTHFLFISSSLWNTRKHTMNTPSNVCEHPLRGDFWTVHLLHYTSNHSRQR